MHDVRIAGTAERQLKKPSSDTPRRVSHAALARAFEPLPDGCRKLTGHGDVYRIRVGGLRILYGVNHSTHTVTVMKVGDRKHIYR